MKDSISSLVLWSSPLFPVPTSPELSPLYIRDLLLESFIDSFLLLSDDPKDVHDYEIWKSHFVTDINDYYAKKEEEISNLYKKSESSYTGSYSKTTSDVVRLLRRIVEAGFSLSTRTKHISQGVLANGFTFKVNELLNSQTDEAKKLFAQFLAEFMYWEKLGAKTYTDMQMPDGSFSITYYVEVSSFSVIVSLINDFIRHYECREGQSEFAIDAFERNFESDLKTYSNDIEDEIKLFSH